MNVMKFGAPLVALAVLVSACSINVSRARDSEGGGGPVTIEQVTDAPEPSSTAEMVERVRRSVVNVRVTGLGSAIGQEAQQGQGSGVIIDESGYVITNNHVVAGAAEVEVVIPGREEKFDGEVIGTAPEKDLAVIKIEADDLKAVAVGESADLRLGDDVVALGYPLGLGGITVTKGIVAGLNRSIEIPEGPDVQRFEGLLQTDAAINPGNSGGALVNSAGQLVGINSAAAQAATAENIGFAIAIDAALPIVREIIEDPPEKRAWLGVSIATIGTPSDALQFGVGGDVRGAAIVEVFPGGPAREAGVRPGEVITAVEDEPVKSQEDLTRVLTGFDPGETVTLTLVGPSGEREVDVELGERPVTID